MQICKPRQYTSIRMKPHIFLLFSFFQLNWRFFRLTSREFSCNPWKNIITLCDFVLSQKHLKQLTTTTAEWLEHHWLQYSSYCTQNHWPGHWHQPGKAHGINYDPECSSGSITQCIALLSDAQKNIMCTYKGIHEQINFVSSCSLIWLNA